MTNKLLDSDYRTRYIGKLTLEKLKPSKQQADRSG